MYPPTYPNKIQSKNIKSKYRPKTVIMLPTLFRSSPVKLSFPNILLKESAANSVSKSNPTAVKAKPNALIG